MPRWEDVHYYPKLIPKETVRIQITKMVDEEFKEAFVVENAECQCPGAIYHRTQCKHMRIKQTWDSLGRPHGYFTVNKAGKINFHPIIVEEV